MSERSVSLFQIKDSRRRPVQHVAVQEFPTGDTKEANRWLNMLEAQFPSHDFDSIMTVLEDEDVTVSSFKIHIEYTKKED